jgi:hypothetical protein
MLKKIIAVTLMAAGLVVTWDGSLAGWGGSCSGRGPGAALLACWIGEFQTPQAPYEQFQRLIANKEVAQCKIERVDLVDTNYVGKYFAVKLKNHPIEFHVRKPEDCREDPIERVSSYGIPVGLRFACL